MPIDSPAVIIFDENGNPVGVEYDGVVYRLQVEATLTDGYVQIGTLSDPIRVDPTGSTAQPVTDNGGSLTVDDGGSSLTVDQNTASNLNAQVQGPDADGVPPTGNPVLTAGYDGVNIQTILTDTGGRPVTTLHDGTYGPVSVKDASTSPTAADKALVVVVSPNQQAIPVSLSSSATSINGLAFGYIMLGGGSAGNLYAIRATTYTEQTTNAQRSVSSNSAADTATGTGARTVLITYYDQTGAGPFTETVTLNGTTAVNTTNTNICFIEKMEVVTVGTGLYNAGRIRLWTTTGGGGSVIGSINRNTVVSGLGDGRTLWAHHYVPLGKTCNITGISVYASRSATFHLKSTQIGVANAASVIISGLTTSTRSHFQRTYDSPVTVVGPSLIVFYGVPRNNGVTMIASFDFFETST